ncbi:unnamed protein product, partial [Nesidiocoris tenuis]
MKTPCMKISARNRKLAAPRVNRGPYQHEPLKTLPRPLTTPPRPILPFHRLRPTSPTSPYYDTSPILYGSLPTIKSFRRPSAGV